jgi:hypothetical protein
MLAGPALNFGMLSLEELKGGTNFDPICRRRRRRRRRQRRHRRH